jgi:hypothetical protein
MSYLILGLCAYSFALYIWSVVQNEGIGWVILNWKWTSDGRYMKYQVLVGKALTEWSVGQLRTEFVVDGTSPGFNSLADFGIRRVQP